MYMVSVIVCEISKAAKFFTRSGEKCRITEKELRMFLECSKSHLRIVLYNFTDDMCRELYFKH